MKIRILTDSACDLRPPHRPEVTVLPMDVTFGEETFQDGVNLTHQQFYEKLIEGDALPTTSQIAPAQFEEAFRAAVEAGETVVAVVLSAKLSGTWQSARIAAEEFPGRVFVVDSANAVGGGKARYLSGGPAGYPGIPEKRGAGVSLCGYGRGIAVH